MTQQPSSKTPVWNWTLPAHILNILSPLTTNISENGLPPPQAIIFFHILYFFFFYSFIISNLLWFWCWKRKTGEKVANRAVPEWNNCVSHPQDIRCQVLALSLFSHVWSAQFCSNLWEEEGSCLVADRSSALPAGLNWKFKFKFFQVLVPKNCISREDVHALRRAVQHRPTCMKNQALLLGPAA